MTPRGEPCERSAVAPQERGKVGYFVFSLDTELAWGDLWHQPHLQDSERDGIGERTAIRRLLDMMDEFGVVATWAITGHLFHERCEECVDCPIVQLKGKDRRFDRIWGTADAMWYGLDVVDMVSSRSTGHEIAFHGYTHRTFDELSEVEARFEIEEWLRLASRKGIAPQSVIFPQGRIRHLALFRDAGFLCYRGREVRHPALTRQFLGRVLNKLNLKLAVFAPQVFHATVDSLGLVDIPGSLWLFRTHRRIELILDALNLHTLRLRPAAKSIGRAAKERKVVHYWIHPQELRTEKDFAKVRYIFEAFSRHAKVGELRSITMAELAKLTLRQRRARIVSLESR